VKVLGVAGIESSNTLNGSGSALVARLQFVAMGLLLCFLLLVARVLCSGR
jgi:hypothetical protein